MGYEVMLAHMEYCMRRKCTAEECAICRHLGNTGDCSKWVLRNPAQAAKLMGIEIMEEDL